MQEKAAGVGFDFPRQEDAWDKVTEELAELKEVMEADDSSERKEEELGDLLFSIVNHARQAGINPENALSRTNDKFLRRFRGVEQRLDAQGISIVDATLEQMDAHWEAVKQEGG